MMQELTSDRSPNPRSTLLSHLSCTTLAGGATSSQPPPRKSLTTGWPSSGPAAGMLRVSPWRMKPTGYILFSFLTLFFLYSVSFSCLFTLPFFSFSHFVFSVFIFLYSFLLPSFSSPLFLYDFAESLPSGS